MNWHGVESEPAELEVSFLFNLGGKKYERLKMKLLRQNSHLIFIFSDAQMHGCSTNYTPSCIIQGFKDVIQEGILAICVILSNELIKRNSQLDF